MVDSSLLLTFWKLLKKLSQFFPLNNDLINSDGMSLAIPFEIPAAEDIANIIGGERIISVEVFVVEI